MNAPQPFKQLFGPSPNTQIAQRLSALAACGVRSTILLKETGGSDYKGISDLEHEGDDIVTEIHELMDSAFILRFDKSDIASVTSELDDIIDATKKVATHRQTYGSRLATLRPEALMLMSILAEMAKEVEAVVKRLALHPIGIEETRPHVLTLKELERVADDTLHEAEKALVLEFGKNGANPIDYVGWEKLYRILERATDNANHCGIGILSIARKEA